MYTVLEHMLHNQVDSQVRNACAVSDVHRKILARARVCERCQNEMVVVTAVAAVTAVIPM